MKIMTATLRSLAIVTKAGEIWVFGISPVMYGDESNAATNIWHQVKSATAPNSTLKAIVQLRMSTLMCFAVDSNNVLYA